MTKEHAGKPSRRETTEDRRRLIVEAAAACFAEKGFHQTSIRDIAERAGISLGNLYNHFDSKQALIAEIASLEADEMEAVEAALQGNGTPDQALERFANAYLDVTGDPVTAVLTAEITAEAMRNPAIAARFEANRKRLVKALKAVIAQGVARGSFDAALDTAETSRLIFDFLDGLAMRMAFSKKSAAARSRKTALAMISRFVAVKP